MAQNRDVDARIAREVLGYPVTVKGDQFFERSEAGERPLRRYSLELEWAQEVMEKMKMTVIPMRGNGWFVFVGPADHPGWNSPHDALEFLKAGNFAGCGAANGYNLPALVCEAALKAIDKRASEKMAAAEAELPQTPNDNIRPIH